MIQTNKQANIPKLRFPEFKDSWVNDKMGNLYTFKVTNSFSRENLNYENGTVKNVHYGDIHTKFQTLFDITKESVPFINSYISIDRFADGNYCKEGDLILADASEDLNDVGKSIEVVNLNNEKVLSGLHTILARPTSQKISLGFVGYLFKSNNIRTQIQKESQGSKVLSISSTRLSNISLVIPSKEEQTKIASFLTAVDSKLQALKKKKSLLEEYKKGVMQRIFLAEKVSESGLSKLSESGLSGFEDEQDFDNPKILKSCKSRFRQVDGSEFPEWEVKKLGEVGEVNPSNTKLPERFIYIDLESVENGQLKKENTILRSEAPSRAQRVLEKNDVLFQMVRPYQMNNLYFNKEGDYVASTGYAQIRTTQNSKYLFHYLHFQNFVDRVIERCTGTSYPAINSTDLSNILIDIPCPEEQTRIADFLSSLDEKIQVAQVQIDKMETWKRGLLQKMFV